MGKIIFWIFFISTIIGGCSFIPDDDDKPVYHVIISPSFRSLWDDKGEMFQECVSMENNTRFTFDETYVNKVSLASKDIFFSLDTEPTQAKVFQLGSVDLFFITQKANPIKVISKKELRNIFIGRMTSWQALKNAIEMQSSFQGDIHLYIYAQYDEVSQFLSSQLKLGDFQTGKARLISNQLSMREAIQNDINGLGILFSKDEVSGDIHKLEINFDGEDEFHIPIIVQLTEEADIVQMQYIGCLQESLSR